MLKQSILESIKPQFAVGLMTGTSLDGIDVAFVKLSGVGLATECELLHFFSQPLADTLKLKIQKECYNESSTVAGICSLNMELGQLYADVVEVVLDEVKVLQQKMPEKFLGFTGKLDFIASHGQTIYHLPQKNAVKMGFMPSTLQIGDPSHLAFRHKTDVYFNFRMMDIAAGGDGAPLVPFTELVLYKDSHKNRLLQNIGGIGNVTIMPKNAGIEDVWAFDTGPGNMMINAGMKHLFQKEYDEAGSIAQKGMLIETLFSELKLHSYLQEKPPKSTGREVFGEDFTHYLLQKYSAEKAEDIIHTFTKFTAFTIAESYRQFIFPTQKIEEVIIGGGGAYNLALLEYLQLELPAQVILTNEDIGISSDAKEAMAFAILGYQTQLRHFGNVPKATGAEHPVVIGQICPNPFGI